MTDQRATRYRREFVQLTPVAAAGSNGATGSMPRATDQAGRE